MEALFIKHVVLINVAYIIMIITLYYINIV